MPSNPDLLGKYRIEKVIGHGSFSTVYRATEVLCDRRVAIKALRGDAYDEGNTRYALTEIGAMGRIWQHPNIVSILTVEPGDDEFLAYIVMEYVEGGSLRARMQQGRMALTEALAITHDMCSGLSYAHANNVVHRDVKPRNVLLNRQGLAKISDFGVAQVREVAHDYASTFAGTRRYMAPEQYEDRYDHRVDIFAAGVLLWEMALGTYPYPGETQEDIRLAKHAEPPSAPDTLPDAVRHILSMSLQPEPHQRFRDMEELRDAVARVLEQEYETLARERLSAGTPAEALGQSVKEARAVLRLSAETARQIEKLAALRHEQQAYDEAAANAAASANHHAEALARNVCKRNFELAMLELQRLDAADCIPRSVTELIEMLCRQLQGALAASRATLPRVNGTEILRATARDADNHARAGDEEKAAALWQESALTLERAARWRKARDAHRHSARHYARAAEARRTAGNIHQAARFLQKAADAAWHARDRRRATALRRQAAEQWLEAARAAHQAGDLTAATDYYRAAAHAWEQAGDRKSAHHHYETAATLLSEQAHGALATGRIAEAETLARRALDMASGLGIWKITDCARRLLERARQARATQS
jgi:tetratricopeptide (TPR) repeat protein